MIIISDATPILSLLKANQLELLQKLYKIVLVPRAVYRELTGKQGDDLLLMDEHKGRSVAKQLKIRHIGTAGISMLHYKRK